MKKITLYELFTSVNYKSFLKQQIIYAFNPIKHFKECVLGPSLFDNDIMIAHKEKESLFQKQRQDYLNSLSPELLNTIFDKEILPFINKNLLLKNNICFECFKNEFFYIDNKEDNQTAPSLSFFKEGYCSSCNQNKLVFNYFLYRQIILKHGFSIKQWSISSVPFIFK